MRTLTKEDLLERRQVDAETNCWNYTGYVDVAGYGIFGSRLNASGKHMPRKAHSFSYETWVGPIEPGMHIHHLCRNKSCFNPDHLVQLDPSAHMREHWGDTCSRGHGEEFWRMRTQNGVTSRFCRECDRLRNAANRARRSIPCIECGQPRLSDKDAGTRRNFTGLCKVCHYKSLRKAA